MFASFPKLNVAATLAILWRNRVNSATRFEGFKPKREPSLLSPALSFQIL